MSSTASNIAVCMDQPSPCMLYCTGMTTNINALLSVIRKAHILCMRHVIWSTPHSTLWKLVLKTFQSSCFSEFWEMTFTEWTRGMVLNAYPEVKSIELQRNRHRNSFATLSFTAQGRYKRLMIGPEPWNSELRKNSCVCYVVIMRNKYVREWPLHYDSQTNCSVWRTASGPKRHTASKSAPCFAKGEEHLQ